VPQAQRLVEVIEKPVVIHYHPDKARIYVGAVAPEKIKVALLSDSPTITTGFGVVTRMVGAGLKTLGYNVVSYGMQDPVTAPRPDDAWPVWRGCPHDSNNWSNFNKYLEANQLPQDCLENKRFEMLFISIS
jgi:hypothetical protein